MEVDNRTGIVGVVSVLALLTLHSISHWSTVETIMGWLVSKGPAGIAARDFLLSPLVPLVIAIAALGVFWTGRQSKAKQQSASLAEPQSKASITGSGNSSARIGDIHIHPVPTPPAHPPVPLQPPPAVRKKEIVLTSLSPIVKEIHAGEHEFWFHGRSSDAGGAILLPIYFDPVLSDAGTYMEFVKASLVFKHESSGKEIRIAHGVWVGDTKLDYREMSLGETAYLILVLLSDDLTKGMTVNTNRTDYQWYNRVDAEPCFDTPNIELETWKLVVVITWSPNHGKKVFEMPLDLAVISKQMRS